MFFILEHLPESLILRRSNSEVVATCPHCGGNKLKINRRTGAYACYSSGCSPKQIRASLGIQPRTSDFTMDYFKVKEFEKPKFGQIVNPKPKLVYFKEDSFFFLQKPPPFHENNVFDNFRFIYNDKHVVRRYTYTDKGKKCKAFSYITLTSSGWVNQVGFKYNWGIYKPFSEAIDSSRVLLFTEGEKVAYCLSSIGLAAITVPSFGFQEDYLDYFINKIKPSGIYYLADNDLEGLKKRDLVIQSCARQGIGCNSFYFEDKCKGFDAADFIFELETRDIVCLRKQLLSTITF